MNNVLGFVSEEAFEESLDETITRLEAIANSEALTNSRIFVADSWKAVQSIVRRGLANQFFKVGDQIQSYHKVYGFGTEKLLTWDILGIDYDRPVDSSGNYLTTTDSQGNIIPMHSLTLQTHDCIGTKYRIHRSAVNNWQNSDLRNWLNSAKVVDGYSENRGFLYGFDPDLLEVIGYVAKVTARSDSEGGKAIVLPERIFLPSVTELFAGFIEGYAEGALILTTDTEKKADKFYCTLDSATGIITKVNTPVGQTNPVYEVKQWYKYYGAPDSDLPSPSFAADTHRIKQLSGSNQAWMTRSPYPADTGYIYDVGIGGNIDRISHTNNTGVAPACVIF